MKEIKVNIPLNNYSIFVGENIYSHLPELISQFNKNRQIAIISTSTQNAYGHPQPEVLQRLWQRGCRIFTTGTRGALTLTSDGSRYKLEGNGEKLLDWTELDS